MAEQVLTDDRSTIVNDSEINLSNIATPEQIPSPTIFDYRGSYAEYRCNVTKWHPLNTESGAAKTGDSLTVSVGAISFGQDLLSIGSLLVTPYLDSTPQTSSGLSRAISNLPTQQSLEQNPVASALRLLAEDHQGLALILGPNNDRTAHETIQKGFRKWLGKQGYCEFEPAFGGDTIRYSENQLPPLVITYLSNPKRRGSDSPMYVDDRILPASFAVLNLSEKRVLVGDAELPPFGIRDLTDPHKDSKVELLITEIRKLTETSSPIVLLLPKDAPTLLNQAVDKVSALISNNFSPAMANHYAHRIFPVMPLSPSMQYKKVSETRTSGIIVS